MPTLLEEIYRLQGQLTGLDPDERHLLKMCANFEECETIAGRWEMYDGMLLD